MSDIQTFTGLLHELLSTQFGVLIVLGLSLLSGFGLLMLRDALFGADLGDSGHGHVDMKRKIIEEEESNLRLLGGKSTKGQ